MPLAFAFLPEMLRWVRKQLDMLDSPGLDWVQVEVTTHCNGSCIYCPHTLMQNCWTNRHMSKELFDALVPFLKNTDLVYLQGWGEPLLNTSFFEMVRICKDKGKRVGFTTNGMLLDDDTLQTLVDLRLDIVAVSLAGTTASTHNQIRKGTDLDEVISHLERLRAIKSEKESQVPTVHLAYLMLRSNFHETNEILPLAKRVEAKQVVASNLALIVDPRLSEEVLFYDTERLDDYGNRLREIQQRADREGIIFEFHGPALHADSLRCRENVHRACVINVEGEVVPCVFTNPVLCGHYIFEGKSLPVRGMSFGNIGNESLTQIWNKKEYAAFRALFDPETGRKPEQILQTMPQSCICCYKRIEA